MKNLTLGCGLLLSISASFEANADQFALAVCNAINDKAEQQECLLDILRAEDAAKAAIKPSPESGANNHIYGEECGTDFVCWASAFKFDYHMQQGCSNAVQRQAKNNYQWLSDGYKRFDYVTDPKLASPKKHPLIAGLTGDQVKFQNGFGVWVNMIYTCWVDTRLDKIIGIEVAAGRL